MGFYRFVESRYLDDALRGELRFTALSYYRLMEKVYEDDWIGDSHEGVAITKLKELSLSPGKDQDGARKKLENVGFGCGSGVNIDIKDAEFICEENGFILSFAVGDFDELKDEMWRDDYDACLSFVDIETLASYVYVHGVDKKSGRKASDLFCYPLVGLVVYGENEVDFLLVDTCLEASPLLKREKYGGQKECRIFFKPKMYLDVDVVTLVMDIPKGYVVEKFRNISPPRIKEWIEPETFPDPLEKLREVRKAIHAALRQHEDFINFEKELVRSYVCTAKFAYWQLRQDRSLEKNRWHRLDTFFCNQNTHGGEIVHFLYLLDKYFSRVTGAPEIP